MFLGSQAGKGKLGQTPAKDRQQPTETVLDVSCKALAWTLAASRPSGNSLTLQILKTLHPPTLKPGPENLILSDPTWCCGLLVMEFLKGSQSATKMVGHLFIAWSDPLAARADSAPTGPS